MDKLTYQQTLDNIVDMADGKTRIYNSKMHLSYLITFLGTGAMYSSFQESNWLINTVLVTTGVLNTVSVFKFFYERKLRKEANKILIELEELLVEKNICIDNAKRLEYEDDGRVIFVDSEEKKFDITNEVKKVITKSK